MLQPSVLYTESILPIVRVSGNNIPIFILLHGCEYRCSRVHVPENKGDQEVRVCIKVSQCLMSKDRIQWRVDTELNCSSAHIW